MLPCGVRTFLWRPALQQNPSDHSGRPAVRVKAPAKKGKPGLQGKKNCNFAPAASVSGPETSTAMKILPVFLLALTISFSLTNAADAPQQRPVAAGAGAGQGREKMREMMLQKFDANKNGTLDADEKAAMMKVMQERKGGAPGATGGAKGGAAKGGGQMQAMMLQKFDANKNGVLDPDEKAAAMKALQERRGKAGGAPGTGAPATNGTNSEGGSKFRRPPEASK